MIVGIHKFENAPLVGVFMCLVCVSRRLKSLLLCEAFRALLTPLFADSAQGEGSKVEVIDVTLSEVKTCFSINKSKHLCTDGGLFLKFKQEILREILPKCFDWNLYIC